MTGPPSVVMAPGLAAPPTVVRVPPPHGPGPPRGDDDDAAPVPPHGPGPPGGGGGDDDDDDNEEDDDDARSTTSGAATAPRLRLPPWAATWNCRSLNEECSKLLAALATAGTLPDVIGLQEICRAEVKTLRWLSRDLGFDLFVWRRADTAPWSDVDAADFRPTASSRLGYGGVAILVRRSAYRSQLVPLAVARPAEAVAVRIERLSDGEKFVVVSMYLVPAHGADFDVAAALDACAAISADVILMDANARSTAWCPALEVLDRPHEATRGIVVENWIDASGYTLPQTFASAPPATTIHGTGIDLIALAPDLIPVSVSASAVFPGRDHLMLSLGVAKAASRFPVRRVQKIRRDQVSPDMLRRWGIMVERATPTALGVELVLRRIHRLAPKGPWTWQPFMRPSGGVIESLAAGSAGVQTDSDAWQYFDHAYSSPTPSNPPTSYDFGDGEGVQPLTTTKRRCKAFNHAFSLKHTPACVMPLLPSDAVPDRAPGDPPPPPVTALEIRMAIDKLRINSASDDVGVSTWLIRSLADSLAPCLAVALTGVLCRGEPLPDAWRVSTFIPLLKKGKLSTDVEGHRPVAITSLTCRLCERVVARRTIASIKRPLHPAQFGFRSGLSTVDALAVVIDKALDGFETQLNVPCVRMAGGVPRNESDPRSCETLLALVDMSDAFSRVPHAAILRALVSFGVPLELRSFIAQWLSGRKGRTFYEGRRSSYRPLPAGVPQGSCLGPLLFILYMDGLLHALTDAIPSVLAVSPLIHDVFLAVYADDVTMGVVGVDETQMSKAMTLWCDTLAAWAETFGLILSRKTRLAVLCKRGPRGGTVYPNVRIGTLPPFTPTNEPSTLLGITVDSQLHFTLHGKECIRKVALRTARIKELSPWVHPTIMLSLGRAVASKLEYASEAWAERMRTCSAVVWEQVGAAHARAMKACCGIMASHSTSDALFAVGARTFAHDCAEKDIRSSFRRSTFPWATTNPLLLNPVIRCRTTSRARTPTYFPDPTGNRRFGQGSRLRPSLLPSLSPTIPPPPAVDRVFFFVDKVDPTHSRESPGEVRRADNEEQQRRMCSLLRPDSLLVEGWCDASVLTADSVGGPDDNDGIVGAGGASVLYPHGTPAGQVAGTVVLHEAPDGACSFSAEISTAIRLLRRLADEARSLRAVYPEAHIVVLVSSDCQSWLQHAKAGPRAMGPFIGQIWDLLAAIAVSADAVGLGFKYAHCKDPRGEFVDQRAADARRAQLPPSTPWHVDAARPVWQQQRAASDAALRSRLSGPALLVAFSPGFAYPKPPPKSLRRATARDICEIRGGHWKKQGRETCCYNLGSRACPCCGTALICTSNGAAVDHMRTCASAPSALQHEWRMLWESSEPKVLRSMHAYCMQFAVGW